MTRRRTGSASLESEGILAVELIYPSLRSACYADSALVRNISN